MKTVKSGDRTSWLIAKASTNNLNSWEKNFLFSIEAQYEKLGTLSERQLEVLDRIANK